MARYADLSDALKGSESLRDDIREILAEKIEIENLRDVELRNVDEAIDQLEEHREKAKDLLVELETGLSEATQRMTAAVDTIRSAVNSLDHGNPEEAKGLLEVALWELV